MNIKKLDFRLNIGVDAELVQALDAARRPRRMTKTAFVRDALVGELTRTGFMSASKVEAAR